MGISDSIAAGVSMKAQGKAAEKARGSVTEAFEYQKGLNEPLIKMGNEQLTALSQAVNSGQFMADESMFAGWSPYQAGTYTPQGMFQYNQRAPSFQGPESVQYSGRGTPYLADTSIPLAFTEYQPGAYEATKYNPGWGGPGAFQYGQNQPQFTPYQQQQPQPQQYTAPDAQAANYWQPEQFDLQKDQIYQSALKNANEAIEASAAAKGMQLSGANLKALQENAVDLSNQYGQEAFNRYQAQQVMQQGAQNYQTEDQYRRYLDSVGIRGAEADQAIQQWNLNRQFGQAANIENAQVGNQLWNTGFQNALSAQQQNYNQYAQNRGMGLQEYQTNVANQQFGYNANMDQYNRNRAFAFDVNQAQNADQLARYAALTGQYNQNLQNQLATQAQAWNQAWTPYEANLGQYNLANQFNYGIYSDYGNQLANAYNTNTANAYATNALQYQAAQDAYARQAQQGLNQYNMMTGLVDYGMQSRAAMNNAAGAYGNSMANIATGQGNAFAAGTQQLGQSNTLLGSLGIGSL